MKILRPKKIAILIALLHCPIYLSFYDTKLKSTGDDPKSLKALFMGIKEYKVKTPG